jgi:SAM-dependent methyltransferase
MNTTDDLRSPSAIEGPDPWALPPGFDWEDWVARWDRMQSYYLVRREERFALLARMVHEVAGASARVVDLGCGPGSLMEAVLDALPQAKIWGIDFDPAVLLLARARLARYGQRVLARGGGAMPRAHVALADLRSPNWMDGLPDQVDAVISATALHWLKSGPLATLYGQIAALLRPGGLFLNADHVGSEWPLLQAGWERRRAEMRAAHDESGTEADRNSANGDPDAPEPWDAFWAAYVAALGVDATEFLSAEADARVLGGWDGGVEQGLPLAWHLDTLREAGFGAVDCFWRCDCDAIYGGFRLP